MILCHYCNKIIELKSKKIVISYINSDESFSHKIGELEFHDKCFFEIAGNEYEKSIKCDNPDTLSKLDGTEIKTDQDYYKIMEKYYNQIMTEKYEKMLKDAYMEDLSSLNDYPIEKK